MKWDDAMGNVDMEKNVQSHGSTKCTFEIEVKFMQNATWQGQINWFEKKKKQNFRSALEMLKLMDAALAEVAEENQTVNWD